MARTKNAKVPEVGAEAPEFNLPSAQGGSLRLGMRTARGPVIVAFLRGPENDEDVEYFKSLAAKEDEINLALGSIVGIGVMEPAPAREFVKASGIKSYVLYDYAKIATPAWGLLERDGRNEDHALPATFLVDSENKIVEAWTDARPSPDEILERVSGITGLPKEPEEDGEEKKPARDKNAKESKTESAEATEKPEKPERKKLSPEEREKRRAERKAARESEGGDKPEAADEEKTKPEAESSEAESSEKKSRGEGSE